MLEPYRVTDEREGNRGADMNMEWQRLGLEGGAQQAHRFFQPGAHFQQHRFQFQSATFHLGKVENVVQQLQQGFTAARNHRHVVALGGIERGFQQQLCHAQHAVQWCAYFVAHVGQKAALGEVGRFRGSRRLLQLLLQFFASGNVQQRANDAPRLAGEVRDHAARVGHPAQGVVRRPQAVLHLEPVAAFCRLSNGAGDGFDVLGVNARQPLVQRQALCRLRCAQQGHEACRALQFLVQQVQVEHADTAGFRRQFQHLSGQGHAGISEAGGHP